MDQSLIPDICKLVYDKCYVETLGRYVVHPFPQKVCILFFSVQKYIHSEPLFRVQICIYQLFSKCLLFIISYFRRFCDGRFLLFFYLVKIAISFLRLSVTILIYVAYCKSIGLHWSPKELRPKLGLKSLGLTLDGSVFLIYTNQSTFILDWRFMSSQ
jgi:hypothetical protein